MSGQGMLWCEWRTSLRMSGFVPDNRQISGFETGPGLVASDPRFFRKHKRTVDLAISLASSGNRANSAAEQKLLKFLCILECTCVVKMILQKKHMWPSCSFPPSQCKQGLLDLSHYTAMKSCISQWTCAEWMMPSSHSHVWGWRGGTN